MEEDWDLQAVVRGCCSSSNSTATASVLPVEDSFACFPSLGFPENENFFSFPDLFETKTVLDEFEQLYKPFLPKFQPPLSPPSPLNNPNPISFQQQQLLLQQQQHRVSVRMKQEQQQPRRTIAASTTISTPRQKRRKNQQKKVVCQVPAEGLSSDMWAWRKYGQKPIKGSPYPRGYYRCSSSKGCLARKQVERSRSDPGMFVITYTAEHNHPIPTHRNSLAGSTRHKLTTPQTPPSPNTNTNNMDKPPSCSSSSPTGLSPTTPLTTSMEEEDDELMLQQSKEEEENDDDLGISEFQGLMTDDLFMELEQFAGPNSTDTIPIGFDDCFTSPHWFSATAAGSV